MLSELESASWNEAQVIFAKSQLGFYVKSCYHIQIIPQMFKMLHTKSLL